MEEMLDDVRHEILTVDSENLGQPTNYEDPATPEVQKIFELLKATEESLHEHTKVTVLVFVTRLMAIKFKFAFSNNCYKELLNLISDVLPENHKMPKDMYQSKKLLSGLGMDYEKIDVCDNNCMLFWKETASEKKCTVYGERRFVEVENDDGLTVTTKIARKQLRYMPLIPRLKRLFISKNTARHMRWHKEGVRENPNVMAHPADTDAWKALDAFDSSFADEVQNVCFGLATDGFSPFNLTATSYDVVADAMYYARIQAIKAWYRANADDRPMPNTKAEWSSIYLTEEQYLEVNRLLHLISHESMYLLY
jgi:hypothetical protein